MAVPFIFDPRKGQTPESLANRRRIAEALMTGGARPRTFGEGLAALGEGIAGRVMMNQVNRAEDAGLGGAPPIPRPNPLGDASPLIPRPSPLRLKFNFKNWRFE